jgi:hypothetical protein
MKGFEGRTPNEFDAVAARLQAGRAHADPLQLDQIKQRVLARSLRNQRRFTFMKSRIATVATILGLLGGTGGAFAIAGAGSSGGPNGGAATAQYCNGKFQNPGKCKGHKKHHHHCKKHHHHRKCSRKHHKHHRKH